jgi:nucleoside-diphosphate-sugar epimerase
MMKLAVVTGAAGFLGRYVAELLHARGVKVIGLGRSRYPALEEQGIQTVRVDVRDSTAVANAISGADTVFHTAAIAGIWGRWSDYYQINTLGTQHVIDACRSHRVTRLVYTSSPSVTFDGGPQRGVDESAPYPHRWLNHYSHSKALAEQLVLQANSVNLATCAIRPHLIFGPRDPHLIPRLLQRARPGHLMRVGDGNNLIDVTYVENAAEAHWQAAASLEPGSSVAGRAYFLSQGEPVCCWKWIDEIIQRSGLPPVKRHISFRAAWCAGALLESLYWIARRTDEPRMTRFLAAQLAMPHHFDISAARRDFGYHPHITTNEGLDRLAASWNNALFEK